MNVPLPDQQIADGSDDERLARIMSELADSQQAGIQVSIRNVCEQHPDLAAEIRQLWATAMVTQAIGQEVNSPEPSKQAVRSNAPLVHFQLPYEFGDFRLEKELGRGGMGIVYRAFQRSLNRQVALKMILKGQFADEAERRRFRIEAEAAARINHPNIVGITEVGEYEGQDYFCMPLIRGGTLSDRLSDGPLASREAAELMLGIAKAIAAAHDAGIIHRDLKPSNILIGTSGMPYVADFGLAKKHVQSIGDTASQSVVGTPAYMAPELIAQEKDQSSPLSDIYSLGAVLYHMLTGRPPFQASSPVELMMMVLNEEPLPVRMLNRSVDRDMEMIVMKCLQKPPDLRYTSAHQLVADLGAFLTGEPISARDGRLSQVIGNLFRETHHANVLMGWGMLWMWHSLILLSICVFTNYLQAKGIESRWAYWVLWCFGFGTWAAVFWWLRRLQGPVTFVERQIAHTWAASMITTILLFPLEWLLDLPVLTLSPVLALVGAQTFTVKAGVLSGQFYIHAGVLLLTAFSMAIFPGIGLTIFGIVISACFFFTGLKYHTRRAAK
ncbi:MAG TPA: serine/threonine-protein kinase [Pirellulaceae bacterium]|nr:serine/threonine-protein kinase [Pirellulaceae bacterium]HMO93647.1 serine/threonine-protein kinase [Pirellulaceae bacterium]HMP70651.1 serine/threonine-protein kinase [Pirellulaceae bacterium]